MWNFKGTLWNSTQNILPIHWKMWLLNNIEILRALRFKSSYAFLKRPPGTYFISFLLVPYIKFQVGGIVTPAWLFHKPRWPPRYRWFLEKKLKFIRSLVKHGFHCLFSAQVGFWYSKCLFHLQNSKRVMKNDNKRPVCLCRSVTFFKLKVSVIWNAL